MSFLPTFAVNSTIYSTITDMHSLAYSIMSAACNLEYSIIGYKEAKLQLALTGGSPVEPICAMSDDSGKCPNCEAHLHAQCKL